MEFQNRGYKISNIIKLLCSKEVFEFCELTEVSKSTFTIKNKLLSMKLFAQHYVNSRKTKISFKHFGDKIYSIRNPELDSP